MLQVVVPGGEFYDERSGEFVTTKSQVLQLEHSLVSISKWESKWKKPFISKDEKSDTEWIDYIRCMTLTQNVNPLIYYNIPTNVLKKIFDYINDPMSATTITEIKVPGQARKKEVITSELIYYWMVAMQIPFECQKWPLNRLITLIRICEIKNTPPKKMSKSQILSRNAALNAARRSSLGTKG